MSWSGSFDSDKSSTDGDNVKYNKFFKIKFVREIRLASSGSTKEKQVDNANLARLLYEILGDNDGDTFFC